MLLTKKLLILTFACLPLYLLKLQILNVSVNVVDLLALLALMAWLKEAEFKYFLAVLKENKFFLISSFLLFVGLITSFLSNDPSLSSLGIILGWFLLPFLLFLFILHIGEPAFSNSLLKSFYFGASLVSLFALIHKYLGVVSFDQRLSAPFSSPNHLAMFLVPAIFVGFFLLHIENKDKNNKKRSIYFLYLLTTLLALALTTYFTYSYAAWLSVILALLLTAILSNSFSRKAFSKPLFACLLFFSLLATQIGSEKLNILLEDGSRSSLASRKIIWQSSLKIITDNPWIGIGPGNFQTAYLSYQQYFQPYLEWAVPQPHNLFFAFWLQTGLLGLFGFFSILFILLQKNISRIKSDFLSLMLLTFFIYFFFHGLVDTPYWKNDLSYVFWLFAGITLLNQKIKYV